jgi:hypothetical protein
LIAASDLETYPDHHDVDEVGSAKTMGPGLESVRPILMHDALFPQPNETSLHRTERTNPIPASQEDRLGYHICLGFAV